MMIRIYKHIATFLLISLFFTINKTGFAQYNDFEIWSTFSVRKKINKNLRIEFEEGIRFNQNSTSLKKTFNDIGLKYSLNKHFAFSLNYRFVQKNNYNKNFSFRHRINIDFQSKTDINRFVTSVRVRYQKKYTDILSSEYAFIPTNYLRTKAVLEYDIAKTSFQPKVSVEIYNGLNPENYFLHNRTRYTISGSYDLNKNISGELYYRIQKDKNVKNPLSSYIIGLGVTYKL